MKRLLSVLLILLLFSSCSPVPLGQQEEGASPTVLHRETEVLSQSNSRELQQAACEFLKSNGFFSSAYGHNPEWEFLTGCADTIQVLWLQKGEAQLIVEIDGDCWRLELTKSFLQNWQVTSFYSNPTYPDREPERVNRVQALFFGNPNMRKKLLLVGNYSHLSLWYTVVEKTTGEAFL